MTYREPNAVRLHISIEGIDPPIWRELVVPIFWDLRRLHLVIQAAFGWCNSHLHEFSIAGLRFGHTFEGDDILTERDARLFDECSVRLRDFGYRPGNAFVYTYDFGDNWEHRVEIIEVLVLDEAPKAARCLDGARARPPEDVGGIPGYERFLEAIGEKTHPEHAELLRWAGGHFDPEWFDLERINKDLANALRANARRPWHQPKPLKSV